MDSMKGHLLLSMPHMADPYFSRSVVFICEHDSNGAMGLIVNKTFEDKGIKAIYPDLVINDTHVKENFSPIYFGGPVSLERVIIIHSSDFLTDDTLQMNSKFSITSNNVIMEASKAAEEPREYRLMQGYAGCGRGKMDRGIENGDWLFQTTDPDFLFHLGDDRKWLEATRSFGIDVAPAVGGQA